MLIFLSKSPGGTARSKCNIWHRLTCRGGRSDGHVMTKISRIYWLPFFLTHGVSLLGDVDLVPTEVRFNCGQQEEPAILISRLLIRMRRMYEASIRLDFTKNVWNSQNAIWSHAFEPSITRNLITRVLTICHVKLTQRTTIVQKRFDLWSLSPALRNLWLLLVIKKIYQGDLGIPLSYILLYFHLLHREFSWRLRGAVIRTCVHIMGLYNTLALSLTIANQ